MKLEEKETIIIFNAKEQNACVETYQKKIWNKLDKKGMVPFKIIRNNKNVIIGKIYKVSKNWIHIYKPREFTEKQKENIRIIMQKRKSGYFSSKSSI